MKYDKTQLLEYELEKRLANVKDMKAEFKKIYAESVKAVDKFINKRSAPPKKSITTSTSVLIYKKVDPAHLKNYGRTAKDNQGNIYGQLSARH